MTSRIRLCIFPLLLSVLITKNAADHFRLPDNVRPSAYFLRLQIPGIDNETFTGSVSIVFNTDEESNDILLHASASINITSIILNADGGVPCKVSSPRLHAETITISCREKTVVNETNTLQINYVAGIGSSSQRGVYRSRIARDGGNVDSLIVTELSPFYARALMPCFDEPRFKASLDLFVTRPKEYDVLASNPITNEIFSKDDLKITQFDTSPPMSPNLFGFLLGKFQNISGDTPDSKFSHTIFTRPQLTGYAGTALKYGKALVDAMGEFTGIPYEEMGNVQLHHVVVPELRVPGVEGWGLLVYRERELLDEAEQTTAASKQRVISIMAHQMSYQWFGGYAPLNSWTESWLNDGFAMYFQYYLPGKINGLDMHLDDQFTAKVLQNALKNDAFVNSSALSDAFIDDNDVSRKKEDHLVHEKGASVIRMMKNVIGENAFRERIKEYLQDCEKGATNTSALLKALKLTNLTEPWIYQSGYPLLHVTLENSDKVQISQEPFTHSKLEKDLETQWNIPLTFTTSLEKNFNGGNVNWLMQNHTMTVPLEPEAWILVNIQQTGFYRVNYDEELWERLIVAINKDRTSIHVLNRAQLIDDVFSIAHVGKTSYMTVFKLADFLLKETEYIPWVSALNSLSYMIDLLTEVETLDLVKSRTLQYINSAFPSLRRSGNTHIDILTHSLILEWKCKLGNENCIEYARNSFEEFQKTGRLSDFNEREVIFCYGAKYSNDPKRVYRYLLANFQRSSAENERETVLKAIGCIADKFVLTSFLGETIDSDSVIPKTYHGVIFASVLANTELGSDVVLDFIEKNFELFYASNEFFPISTIVTQLSDKIKNEDQLNKFVSIVWEIDLYDLDNGKLLDRINYNLKWSAENTENIKSSLIAHHSHGFTFSPPFSTILLSNLLLFIYYLTKN